MLTTLEQFPDFPTAPSGQAAVTACRSCHLAFLVLYPWKGNHFPAPSLFLPPTQVNQKGTLTSQDIYTQAHTKGTTQEEKQQNKDKQEKNIKPHTQLPNK